jgi:hypothetical protein
MLREQPVLFGKLNAEYFVLTSSFVHLYKKMNIGFDAFLNSFINYPTLNHN